MTPKSPSKVCKYCQTEKPVDEFYRHRWSKDGFSTGCKSCTKAKSKAYRDNNIEACRERERNYYHENLDSCKETRARYRQTDRGKEALNRGQKRYAERYPEKIKAQTAVNNAVRDGKLPKQPCEVCGNPKAHAHHDDYTKPLDVRWLCTKHHEEHHHTVRCSPGGQTG